MVLIAGDASALAATLYSAHSAVRQLLMLVMTRQCPTCLLHYASALVLERC